MALTDEQQREIIGDEINTINPFVIYDVEKDFPFIHTSAIEHIKMCLPCAQKAITHHVGVGNPLDEEGIKIGVAYVSQISEKSNIILEQVNRVLVEHEKQIKELHNVVTEVTDLVKKNSETNTEVLTELKDNIKKDLTKFYKIVSVVSVPLVIITSFVISWISR
jgi:hypothetical protein